MAGVKYYLTVLIAVEDGGQGGRNIYAAEYVEMCEIWLWDWDHLDKCAPGWSIQSFPVAE